MGFSLDVNLCTLTHAGPIQVESCKGVESYKVFARPIQSFTKLRFAAGVRPLRSVTATDTL